MVVSFINKTLTLSNKLNTNFMKAKEEIIKIIEEKLGDVEYENTQIRMSDEYYVKNNAKIQVLEEILRLIAD